jgi:phospholipid/cholesterol/gamma-HCH transport system substrate-binding protein
MRSAIVGAFVIGGLLLFGAGLFLIGDRRLLFVKQYEIHSTFGKVTGLQVGTRVRVAGLDAGEVTEVRLPSRPSEKFLISMRVRDDVARLVRADSTAAIQTDGIVGNAFIQISVGTDDSPQVKPGDTIPGTYPIEFADLIQEGRDTFRTVAAEMIDVKDSVNGAIDGLSETIDIANGVAADVGREAAALTKTSNRVMESVQATVADGQAIIHGVQQGQGTIGMLLTDRALYDRMANASQEVEQAMQNVRATTETARAAVSSFSAPDGAVQQVALTLRNSLAQVQEVTSDLAENTEALKRNFLFRGFFRQRGFFDLDSISREAYLSGVVAGKDRTPLRIWIDADGLFTRDADGTDRLTADGRRRLDSAMADLVRYPRDSPLVIEGYADSNDPQAPYLVSVDRAQTVHDYLIDRFRRRTTLTDIMPLSDVAAGSPRGDGHWSGVALTLFVRKDALGAAQERPASR